MKLISSALFIIALVVICLALGLFVFLGKRDDSASALPTPPSIQTTTPEAKAQDPPAELPPLSDATVSGQPTPKTNTASPKLPLNFSPETEEEKEALRNALSAALHEPGSDRERMARVKPFIEAMNPVNSFLMRDVFAASWDAGNHFVAEHVLQWKKLGEIVGEETANRYVTPNGAWGYVYGDMLESWAKVAPDDAIAWMNDFPISKNRTEVVVGIIKGIANKDPQGAIKLVAELPAEEIGPSLMALDSAATLDYTGSGVPDYWSAISSLASEDVENILLSFADTQPEKSLEWAVGIAKLGGDVGPVPAEIGALWVQQDLKGLSDWLTRNPRHSMRDELTLSLIREIAGSDPDAARSWLRTIEDAGIKQKAAAAVE